MSNSPSKETKNMQRINKVWLNDLSAPENDSPRRTNFSKADPLKTNVYKAFSSKPPKSVIERASFFDESSQQNTSKNHLKKATTSDNNKPNKVFHDKNNTPKNTEPFLIKKDSDVLKSPTSAINRERIAMLAAKMELKAPPPKPPIQLSLVIQEYKAPKSSNKLENAYDAPKQPQIPHYSPFMLADLEATDSESSYSSDEGDTGQVLPIKNPNGNGSPQDKKKTVSFSDKVMIIPDYIYEEEECKPVPSEKKHSVQNIMTNINKMNSKKRDKPMKQTAQSPQRLSNKLLDFFQQKRIFTSDKSSYPSVKANLDTKPEPLTHLTKNRPRKPSSMRKSREVKIVL